ncbi:SPOR domain-containing protein [Candidatus Glomeribacter gigasporarum]|nr:SPOR domain-containing protein [Candidatus Glomeribacter gigasporarum]
MFIGLVLGLIAGLAIAIAVALYITRAPSPIVQKDSAPERLMPFVPSPSDPNRSLQGQAPAEPAPAAPLAAQFSGAQPEQTRNQTPHVSEASPDDTQIIEVSPPPVEQPASRAPEKEEPVSARPAPSPSRPAAHEAPRAEINTGYYLQAGVYRAPADAEARRAQLALQGFEAGVSRQGRGRYMTYRVRMGPFMQFDEMRNMRQQLTEAGIRTVVIRFRKARNME